MDQCNKGSVSSFTLLQLSDIQRVHTWLKGSANSLADSLSRFPVLGEKLRPPKNLEITFIDALKFLPDRFQLLKRVAVFAGRHTSVIARAVQRWRQANNSVDTRSLGSIIQEGSCDFCLVAPAPDRAPQTLEAFLTSNIPFALLIPIDLIPQVGRTWKIDGSRHLEMIKKCGKIILLASTMAWIFGNVPELSGVHEVFSGEVSMDDLDMDLATDDDDDRRTVIWGFFFFDGSSHQLSGFCSSGAYRQLYIYR